MIEPQTIILKKIFIVDHSVYFNETNAVGGVAYFSNYVKWQGMTREEWFVKVVPNWRQIFSLVNEGKLNMITVEEHSHFIQHAFFGDKIEIRLQMTNIKRFSFDMIFLMFNKDSQVLLYEGLQRLAFDDFKGKFVPIPDGMAQAVKQYEANLNSLQLVKLKKYISVT